MHNHSFETEFTHRDVDIEEEEIVYRGFFHVKEYHLRHRLFAGGWSESLSRSVFARGDAVGVLLYDPNLQAVVLVEQFRPGALNDTKTPWVIEPVAGSIPAGEEPATIAIKEIFEETGFRVAEVRPMLSYYVSPGSNSEKFHLFYAIIDASFAGGIHGLKEEHEDIRVRVVSLEDCKLALNTGKINNALTVIALQWLQLHYQELDRIA